MSANINQEQFSIPEQTLRTLSFCEPTSSHLTEWVQQLPMVNLGESSRQLYHAIIELNQLAINPETRFKLIEIVRPAIQHVCQSLMKHYLNQPVLLPTKARKVSRLAMALDNHLMVAYKSVIHDRKKLSQTLLSKKPKRITAQAIYHAISITAQMIIRAYHLYTPAPEKAWHELHQLYLIAESNKLLDSPIEDNRNKFVHKTTIEDAYKRALMIGCCKANQIRQNDISNIYDATELWSKNVSLTEGTKTVNFTVNLNEDSAPVYSELSSGKNSPFCRGIDLQLLLNQFKEYLALADKTQDAVYRGISVPATIKKHLLSFLLTSWETLTERTATRLASDKSVKTCIGFSATHFFLSGGVDFETQLQRDGSQAQAANQFHSRDVKQLNDANEDPWTNAFDAERSNASPDHRAVDMQKPAGGQMQDDLKTTPSSHPSFPQYTARLLDISPNGYCMKWENDVPAEIKAGEIIGINEQEHHIWSVGAIRWISQPKAGITTMGVELLATSAIPCGAKAITGSQAKSDFMRALLLPAQEAVGQPASFIAPNMPFKENLSVILNQYGETSQGLLGNCTLSTGSFSQFIFEPQALRADLSGDDSDVDDIWPEI
jgi:cyclic-di-GMP-binding protein